MPTFGWVYEDAWERISATEHVPDRLPPGPQVFICPICSATMASSAALQGHLYDMHRVSRPVMLISGLERGRSYFVRQKLSPKEISIANATSIALSVDGAPLQPVSPSQLGDIVAALTTGTVRVRLQNAPKGGAIPVIGDYELSIRVASAKELRLADQAFSERLNIEHPSVSSVEEFLADSRCQGAGSDYATGLAEYILGILIKERPDGHAITSPLAKYSEHFGSALLRLAPHSQPLPRLICAFMRFALNDFSGAGTMTGHASLDEATVLLNAPSVPQPAAIRATGTKVRVCPVDHGTSRILDLSERLSAQQRWSPVLGDECRQVASAGTLDIMDQQKALALWAMTAWRLNARQDALEPLERISATYPFETWASKCLQSMTA